MDKLEQYRYKAAKVVKYEIRIGVNEHTWSQSERWEIWALWDNGNEHRFCIVDTDGAGDFVVEWNVADKICSLLKETIK
jgi:septin family protein